MRAAARCGLLGGRPRAVLWHQALGLLPAVVFAPPGLMCCCSSGLAQRCRCALPPAGAGHRPGGPAPHAPHPPGPGAQLQCVLLRDPQLARARLPPGQAGGDWQPGSQEGPPTQWRKEQPSPCSGHPFSSQLVLGLLLCGALAVARGNSENCSRILAHRHSTRRLLSWIPWGRSLTRTAPSSCSSCATTSRSGPATCRQVGASASQLQFGHVWEQRKSAAMQPTTWLEHGSRAGSPDVSGSC